MAESSKPAAKKSTSTARRAPARKAAPAKRTTTRKAAVKKPAAPRPMGRAGSNERATWEELRAADLLGSAHARLALEMAKWVDKADSPAAAAVAGRELRMQMTAARNTGKPVSPPTAGGDRDDDSDEQPTPAGVPSLAAMRARADARRSS